MKLMRYFSAMVIATMSIGYFLSSCASDSESNGRDPQPVDAELTITGISDTQWTYVSLETNSVIGTSPLDDSDADAQWADRTDWDIAICGDMIRTNSGSSGKGQGGIRRLDDKTYEEITAGDAVGLDQDRPQSPDASRQ